MATLGQKLRELRHQKGFKLNEVAEGADLSISFISLIERDRASISVENLQKLANFYNVRLFQIFQDIEEEDLFVIKEKQVDDLRDRVDRAEPVYHLLFPEDNHAMKIILAYLPPSSDTYEMKLQRGEAFITIKEGQLEAVLPNKKPLLMSQGDSALLSSFKGTTLRNTDKRSGVHFLIVAPAITQLINQKGDPVKLRPLAP